MAGQDNRWMALCLLLVAVVAAMDASLPSGGIEAVLLVGPVFASSQLNPRRTAFVAVVALAAGLSIAALHRRMDQPDVIIRLVALLVVGAFCVASAQARERRERALTRVTKVAEVAQLAILHKVPAQVGPIAFATRYLSAARDAFVGGDFYDVVATGGVVRVVVGDVRGKGLDAVNLAALVAGCFREAAATQEGLPDVARAVDRAVAGHLLDEDFVTAVFVEFGPGAALRVVNCGHYPPLRLGADQVTPLEAAKATTPLGLHPELEAQTYWLEPGDRVLLYTDGLVEARGRDRSFFPIEDQTRHLLARTSLDTVLDGLVARLLAHVGGRLDDDLALVLAERQAEAK